MYTVTALIATIVSAVIALIVSKRSSYITAVTAERSKWIDKLRENIAELLGVCGAIQVALPEKKSAEVRALMEKADRFSALIMMQLNPRNPIDANMLKLLPRLIDCAQKENSDYRAIEKAFVLHAQFLLKEEWEKVKRESMSLLSMSSKSECKLDEERRDREKAYSEFCKTQEAEFEG